jgi:hypothetical protein
MVPLPEITSANGQKAEKWHPVAHWGSILTLKYCGMISKNS